MLGAWREALWTTEDDRSASERRVWRVCLERGFVDSDDNVFLGQIWPRALGENTRSASERSRLERGFVDTEDDVFLGRIWPCANPKNESPTRSASERRLRRVCLERGFVDTEDDVF